MKYSYKNLKTKDNVEIDINKKYSFIYAPNGTGKTTFARSINNGTVIEDNNMKKIHLVFSQDFVNNNIYISTSDGGYKADSKNKSKLKQIFLGDTSKEDNEKLIFLRNKNAEYNKIKFDVNIFKNDFKDIVEELLKEDEQYNEEYKKYIMNYIQNDYLIKYSEQIKEKMKKEKFEIDVFKLIDENYLDKVILPKIECTYSIDKVKEELIDFLKDSYNKQEMSINIRIDNLNKFLMNTINTEKIEEIIDKLDQLLNSLNEKKEQYQVVLKIQERENEFIQNTFSNKNLDINDIASWIKSGHIYHKEIDFQKCLYCRNNIDENIKNDYIMILTNKYLNEFKKYEEIMKNIFNIINNIENEYNEIDKYEWYNKTKREKEKQYIKIMITSMKRIKKAYELNAKNKNYYNNIVDYFIMAKKYIQNMKKYLNILIENENEENKPLLKGYQLYLNSNKFQQQLKVELIKETIIQESKLIEEKIKKDTQDYIEKIKNFISVFEEIYEPRIKLNLKSNITKSYNSETTIELISNENNFLNNISEGEKNVLALIIFFSYVKNTIINLKENEQVVIILDDPVNSNDWNNFFKFQAIIEDYFYADVNFNNKISNIIILSHNIDYAVIQLQNDRYYNNFELIRLFQDRSEKIETDFLFMDDIKLGSKILGDLLKSIDFQDNICYVDKKKLYRVAIYMRKFLESFILGTISISDSELKPESVDKCICFLKENIDSENINILLDVSTKIIKDVSNEVIDTNTYMHYLIEALYDMTFNYKLFKENSRIINVITELKNNRYIFEIKNEINHKIKADNFNIDETSEYEEILIDTIIKGLVKQIYNKKEDNDIIRTKKQAEKYFLNYLRHVNDNVGRPVLAVNSDKITN